MTSVNFPKYGTVSITLDVVADLRTFKAVQLKDGLIAFVRGQTATDDGLGGIFVWTSTSTATDDGVTTFAVDGITLGRWSKTVRSIVGPQGATGSSGVGVVIPDSQARFASLAIAKVNTIPALVKYIDTLGFSTSGDGGSASYQRVAADPAQGAGCFRSQDRFMPDGSTDAANGGWWSYVVQGPVDIEQFGGRCDCPFSNFTYNDTFDSSFAMPASYTDNLQPLYDAIKTVNSSPNITGRNEAGSLVPIRFFRNLDTTKCYGFSNTIIPQYTTFIQGTGSGGDSVMSGTVFRFPPNTTGIQINHAATQPAGYRVLGAGFSTIQGIWFQGGAGSNRNAHGIHHRVAVRVFQCVFDSFAGHNVYNIGSVGYPTTDPRFGITSGTHFIDVLCRNAGMWNTWIEGSDVSASQFDQLQHKVSRLGGLLDIGYFANTYNNYGNHGHGFGHKGAVTYNGYRYALVSLTPGIGGTTTPGTNDRVWEQREANATPNTSWPTWVSGGSYECSLPSYISASGTQMNCYIENYYLPQVGGTVTGTPLPGRYAHGIGSDPAAGVEVLHNQNFGWRYRPPTNDASYPIIGGEINRRVGGGAGSPTIIDSWATERSPGGWSMEYAPGGMLRFGLGFVGSGSPMAYQLSDANTTATLGRPIAAPGFFIAANFALAGPNGSGIGRVHYTLEGPPDGKYYDAQGVQRNRAAGEIGYVMAPSKGTPMMYVSMGDGTTQPVGIVGGTRATGLSSGSTLAQVIQALKDAGLAD